MNVINCRLGWVSQPNQRGTIDIIWSCFLVLFVGVWTVVHLNIPAQSDKRWDKLLRKARWSTMAICAPELMSLFASMQWSSARDSVKEMHEIGDNHWTIAHGFYANMGGFMLKSQDERPFPVNAKSLLYLRRHGYIKPPEITRRDIWDRSKTDKFAKGVAFAQTAWLTITCIARAIQSYTVTPMEIFTLAFVVCTAVTGFFWLNKPQSISLPTIIEITHPMSAIHEAAGGTALDSWLDTPMDFVEKPCWEGWQRRPSLANFGGLRNRPLEREPDDFAQPPPRLPLAVCMWALSMLHAGIHITGWNFSFATPVEQTIWRSCSIIMLVVMSLGGAVPVISRRPWFNYRMNLLWIWTLRTRDEPLKPPTFLQRWLFDFPVHAACTMYVIARICLIGEVFYSLHSLPATAYVTVQWTYFLPHV